MSTDQQGDVLLFQTADDGDIEVEGGMMAMGGGLGTAAYLSLFGGNEEDDGSPDSTDSWWGNYSEVGAENTYRSETQNLLRGLPPSSQNLARVADAARRDLSWFTSTGVASTIDVQVRIPSFNRIQIDVSIIAEGLDPSFTFTENWSAGS